MILPVKISHAKNNINEGNLLISFFVNAFAHHDVNEPSFFAIETKSTATNDGMEWRCVDQMPKWAKIKSIGTNLIHFFCSYRCCCRFSSFPFGIYWPACNRNEIKTFIFHFEAKRIETKRLSLFAQHLAISQTRRTHRQIHAARKWLASKLDLRVIQVHTNTHTYTAKWFDHNWWHATYLNSSGKIALNRKWIDSIETIANAFDWNELVAKRRQKEEETNPSRLYRWKPFSEAQTEKMINCDNAIHQLSPVCDDVVDQCEA